MTTTDYGEGFLPIGIGYYHQSLIDSIEPNTTDASNPIQQQLSFVAADGRNTIISDADTATSANANADAEAEAEAVAAAATATTTARMIVQQALSSNNDMAISKQLPSSEKSYETQLSSSIERDAHVARNKAMDIIRKIHQQSKQRGDAVEGSNTYLTSCHPKRQYDTGDDTERERIQGITHTSLLSSTAKATATTEEETTMKITATTITTPPWELKRRRRDCLDRFEERIKRAFFKNLEHVSCIEEERLKHQIQNIDKAKTLEQQLQDRYDQRMEARQQQRRRKNANNNNKNDINLCAAGIGTKQRNRAEKKRKQTALPSSLRNEQQNSRDSGGDKQSSSSSSSSVAIYVSCEGGSSPHGVVEEAILKALFESYGSIRKIHFYIDKKTGTKKGDALIIYSLQDGEDATSLAESVCSQVCTLQLQQ